MKSAPSVERGTLQEFYAKVRPPGWWRPVAIAATGQGEWTASLVQWGIGTFALLATTIGPLLVMLGPSRAGWLWCAAAACAWVLVLASARRGWTAHTTATAGPPSGGG